MAAIAVQDRRGGPTPAAVVAGVRASLATVDVEALSDHERVALVAELERLKGAAAACQARATDALRVSREAVTPQDVARSVGSEVALARHESPSTGDRFVGLSRALVREMPCLMAALTDGAVSERAAVEVVRETATLTREHRAEVDRRIADALPRLSARMAGGPPHASRPSSTRRRWSGGWRPRCGAGG
ncbi:MAG: hypothetical protein IE926_02090 [Micrococcales bacterium]|nr:hypothetical protein [Micrococcales bacterium]